MEKIKYTLLLNKIDAVTHFLDKYLSLANCHMVEFITKNHWESLISDKVRSDVEKIGIDRAINLFWCVHESKNIPGSNFYSIGSSVMFFVFVIYFNVSDVDCYNLLEFLKGAHEHTLKEDNIICHSVSQFKTKLHLMGCADIQACKINEFMSPKKSHEV